MSYDKFTYILNTLNNTNNKRLFSKDEQMILNLSKQKLHQITCVNIGLGLITNYLYMRFTKRLISRRLYRLISDFGFVISMTYIFSYIHTTYINKIYNENLVGLTKKYKYLLKNSIGNEKEIKSILDYLYNMDSKHFYFILFLIMRILFK
jgi:hypothetical protein